MIKKEKHSVIILCDFFPSYRSIYNKVVMIVILVAFSGLFSHCEFSLFLHFYFYFYFKTEINALRYIHTFCFLQVFILKVYVKQVTVPQKQYKILVKKNNNKKPTCFTLALFQFLKLLTIIGYSVFINMQYIRSNTKFVS